MRHASNNLRHARCRGCEAKIATQWTCISCERQ